MCLWIHHKELVHVIMEDDGFQDLWLAGWETLESPWYDSGLKAGRLESQEELMFWFESEGNQVRVCLLL